MVRGWWFVALVAMLAMPALAACDDEGSGAESDAGSLSDASTVDDGGPSLGRIEDATPYTLLHSSTQAAMVELVTAEGFDAASIGDPALYQSSTATEPTHPDQLSSLFYETAELQERLSTLRDRREGLDDGRPEDRVRQRFALDLTLGNVADGPPGTRGSAGWHGRQAARSLEVYLLITTANGLLERTAAGFDRALGVLWDDGGQPHGLGATIAAGDAACGTAHLQAIHDALAGARAPFMQALAELGKWDQLDRLKIEPGESPEYDAAMETSLSHLEAGVAVAFLHILAAEPLTAMDQAEALGAYTALMARVAHESTDDDSTVAQQLDQAEPGNVDRAAIRQIIQTHFGVGPCAR